jgi:hypothetical protein
METLRLYVYVLAVILLCSTSLHADDLTSIKGVPEVLNVTVSSSATLEVQIPEQAVIAVPLVNEKRTLPYTLDAGDIGFIVFDAQDRRESAIGQLYTLRRSLKAKTWVIAISTTPCDGLPMRTQLTLFEDDPVDAFLTPEAMPEAYEGWLRTLFLAYPTKEKPLRVTPKQLIVPKKIKKVQD